MLFDCHVHVFSKALVSERERYFDGEPVFRLLYDNPKSKLIDAETLISSMDEQGVDRSVIFGFPWNNGEICRRENDAVLEAVTRYPKRLVGLGCFQPAAAYAERECERVLAAGLSGIGELAFYETGPTAKDTAGMTSVMEMCRTQNAPVLFHANEPVGHGYPGKSPNTLAQIYGLVRRFPENKIILAHFGGGLFFYSLLKRELKQALANVWFDTAAAPFLYDPHIYRVACDIAGAEKILFGSDYPLINPDRYVKEIAGAGLTSVEQKRLFHQNAEAFFPPQ